jgi:hypothetical protein
VDVFACTSRLSLIEDEELRSFIEKDMNCICNQIQHWNAQVYESSFARNFKVLFVRCKNFYESEIDKDARQLAKLNTAKTKLQMEYDQPEIMESLDNVVTDLQRRIKDRKDMVKKLKALQDEFFTEIKFISDIVGIAMPEPSEIDLLQDNVQNPLELIEGYMKKKGMKPDRSIMDMLKHTFDGIEPVINKKAGGSEYKDQLIQILQENCNINPDDIHINDVLNNKGEYEKLIRQV